MTPAEVTNIIISIGGILISGLIAFIVSSMKIGEYKNKVDTLTTTVGGDEHCGLRKTLTDTKTEVDKLLEFKTNAQKFIDKNLYKDQSPLSLTEFGESLVTESGFLGIFPSVRDDLVRMLELENPTTQYDVQEMARGLMDNLTDYAAFQSLKSYAFEHGKDYQQILRAGAILLRDYYLEKHDGLPE